MSGESGGISAICDGTGQRAARRASQAVRRAVLASSWRNASETAVGQGRRGPMAPRSAPACDQRYQRRVQPASRQPSNVRSSRQSRLGRGWAGVGVRRGRI